MGVRPLRRKKKERKRQKRFIRFQSDRFMRVSESWRKPRGIDGRIRRKKRGQKRLVNIGYANDVKTRHILPNGFKKLLIRNVGDLELLLMNNRSFCGEIARTISVRQKAAIAKRALELNVRLTNGKGRL